MSFRRAHIAIRTYVNNYACDYEYDRCHIDMPAYTHVLAPTSKVLHEFEIRGSPEQYLAPTQLDRDNAVTRETCTKQRRFHGQYSKHLGRILEVFPEANEGHPGEELEFAKTSYWIRNFIPRI